MAKAVLIIDMPEKCTDCIVGSQGSCRFSQEIILQKLNGRPNWCPLRELPEEATEMTDADDNGGC